MPIKRLNQGFTLIELLVVIAIIGILAALLILRISSALKDAKDTRARADLNRIANVVNAAKQRTGKPLGYIIEEWYTSHSISGNPWWSAEDCYGKDLRNLNAPDSCIVKMKATWDAISNAAGVGIGGSPARDVWNSPYMIDADEMEPLPNPNNGTSDICNNPKDQVFSAGPDGYAGTHPVTGKWDGLHPDHQPDNVICHN